MLPDFSIPGHATPTHESKRQASQQAAIDALAPGISPSPSVASTAPATTPPPAYVAAAAAAVTQPKPTIPDFPPLQALLTASAPSGDLSTNQSISAAANAAISTHPATATAATVPVSTAISTLPNSIPPSQNRYSAIAGMDDGDDGTDSKLNSPATASITASVTPSIPASAAPQPNASFLSAPALPWNEIRPFRTGSYVGIKRISQAWLNRFLPRNEHSIVLAIEGETKINDPNTLITKFLHFLKTTTGGVLTPEARPDGAKVRPITRPPLWLKPDAVAVFNTKVKTYTEITVSWSQPLFSTRIWEDTPTSTTTNLKYGNVQVPDPTSRSVLDYSGTNPSPVTAQGIAPSEIRNDHCITTFLPSANTLDSHPVTAAVISVLGGHFLAGLIPRVRYPPVHWMHGLIKKIHLNTNLILSLIHI